MPTAESPELPPRLLAGSGSRLAAAYPAPPPESWLSCRLLQLAMLQVDVDVSQRAQVGRQTLSTKDRTVLPTGAAEAHGQVGEGALAVMVHCLVNQTHRLAEELLHRRVFFQKLDHLGILSVKIRIRGKATGIWQSSAIKHETSAMTRLVPRQAVLVGKTLNVDRQSRSRLLSQLSQRSRFDKLPAGICQHWQLGQPGCSLEKNFEIAQRV